MPASLPREDRLRLMKFVCSFAWADLEVQAQERDFVGKMIEHLELEDARAQVEGWLRHPPPPEEVDPTDVPREHRELFLDAVRRLVAADERIDPKEAETLALFEQLLV
ncbi:Tellurite resistance protein TerB [Enhygromyxa salina]|uniref:Tellurite resistance protein TerB n=1 Tax=Enhygromyxa salina TaxID=215803 RepID=A0A2S9YE96_9BACT|nr:TerB family tellurite resistance protein [Enhygromyxa salina]PRQ03448.1 Tellurite resistance protein TerB [Enhygromyxa salina]